jgi:CheY-like chemotaxis protein
MARLLFIDDDPFTLETLTRAVTLLGHQALVANSGEDAVKVAAQETPDLIFTDMQLQDTDGVTLVTELHEIEHVANIPMFILSASPAVDAVERARKAGARAYLDKPIRIQTLLEIIQEYAPG